MISPKIVVNMTIRSISPPYDVGKTVEVIWQSERKVGESRTFRAEFPVEEVTFLGLEVGQIYAVPFYHLRPLFSAIRPIYTKPKAGQ